MSFQSFAAVTAWRAACEPARRRLRAAVGHPEAAQSAVLGRLLSANYRTEFGRAHGLRPGMTTGEFQAAVPVRSYDDFLAWIERAKAGAPGVLSASAIEAFERSSGSTADAKFIPYTAPLRAELGEAVRAWMGDVFSRHPESGRGPAWWITSPLRTPREATSGGIPVGLDGDEDYLGWWERRLAPALWAVPTAIRAAGDWDATLAWTLRFLLQAPDLRLISVWNPSLLEMLWNRFMIDAERWLDLLGTGKGPSDHPGLARHLQPEPKVAAALKAHLAEGTLSPAVVWPELALVSAWEAAEAAPAAATVRRLFSHAGFQPKGLMATEGVISIPWLDDTLAPVPALRSHFLEFEELEGRAVRLVYELEQGRDYGVVLSTGGGFFRLRLGDIVRVEGTCGRVPRLRLMGRSDGVCDLRGEKLHPAMVRRVLDTCQASSAPFRFAMLAPERLATPPRYVVFLGDGAGKPEAVAMGQRVEAALAENPHYAHCRAVGQLASVQVHLIRGAASESYLRRCLALGQVAGTVKPTALSRHDGWAAWFDGEAVEVSP